jgi:hypothetical protein
MSTGLPVESTEFDLRVGDFDSSPNDIGWYPTPLYHGATNLPLEPSFLHDGCSGRFDLAVTLQRQEPLVLPAPKAQLNGKLVYVNGSPVVPRVARVHGAPMTVIHVSQLRDMYSVKDGVILLSSDDSAEFVGALCCTSHLSRRGKDHVFAVESGHHYTLYTLFIGKNGI